MFDKISSAKNRTARFIDDHRMAIAAVATATVCFTIHRGAVNQWNEFLEENDLTDKFYLPED